jgi:hypothetical protein
VKQDASFFEGKESVLVFIARKLADALKLEAVLEESGIDFGVEADEYRGGIIFRTIRTGAFFYVLPEAVAEAHQVLQSHGYTPHVE